MRRKRWREGRKQEGRKGCRKKGRKGGRCVGVRGGREECLDKTYLLCIAFINPDKSVAISLMAPCTAPLSFI